MSSVILLGLILLLAVCLAVASQTKEVQEGFKPLTIPTPGPPAQPIGAGETAAPYLSPIDAILSAPIGQTSEVTSRPFQDPSRDKAPYSRIYELLQDMKAFSDFEAEKLKDTSDPEISLPMTNFRADLQRLEDEVAFLNRNPGIQSSLMVTDVQGIRVNLSYLQKKARHVSDGVIEGFEDATPSAKASKSELENAKLRVDVEIARLQASGTTDPAFAARITLLQRISEAIDTIVKQLKNNTMLPSEVPITEKDLRSFLPSISDPSSPVTRFLNSIDAPGDSHSLFPAYQAGDVNAANLANKVLNKLLNAYDDKYNTGVSWDLSLHYGKGGSSSEGFESTTGGRGAFDQAISQIENDSGVRPTLPKPNADHFNWKDRASQICESVRMRGLDPADFGCLANPSKVGQDFSWRGYAKMVCTRLQTTTDEGLPETCGCPPIAWPGWRQ